MKTTKQAIIMILCITLVMASLVGLTSTSSGCGSEARLEWMERIK